MKKLFTILVLVGASIASVAQDVVPEIRSKKGEAYLPVEGEWGLGISANPFLDYLGNFLNGSAGNAGPDFDYAANPANNIAIFGKLIKDANTAYRVRFNIHYSSNTDKGVVIENDLNADPLQATFVDDERKTNTFAVVIAPGIEKRRGSTRLQGIYGGELVIGFNSVKRKFDYGNAMSADFTTPNTYNFATNATYNPAVRETETKFGTSFLIGARGFIGVEYFFAPKISIGGEFGYMLGFQSQSRGTITTETWDAADTSTRETETDFYDGGTGLKSFGIGLDNLNGAINLLFYF